MGNATAADVLANRAAWSCVASDAAAFLESLPDDSVDMLFTSPPYEAQRTYGIGFKLQGQAWVDWMVGIVRAAAPKVKGLIAVNCEGRTKDYRYSCTPFLLVADLHRAGFNLRKPAVFHRYGIAGSGGPDWLRNDWEPVLCVARPGALPWSKPTACGKPPKFSPGGAMSNRRKDGSRASELRQRMKVLVAEGKSQREAAREVGFPLGGTTMTSTKDDTVSGKTYVPPEIANPGNVVRCKVGKGHMGHDMAHDNEAPFPLKLAEFFVKSFCPPGGVCCDIFSGSGTTCHAAFENGRRFVGADIRQSQVQLCERRMATVTPSLFNEVS